MKTNNPNPIYLGVNIDHVATIRQSRGTRYPDPIQAALAVEQAGADAVTIHLREDRRHIQDRDVSMLIDILQTRMNLEMAVTDEMLKIASHIKPQDCCLVPERREELTTEGGLNVAGQKQRVKDACTHLREAGVRVSLFIDPDPVQVEAAAECGAQVIELHTGNYADAENDDVQANELHRIVQAMEKGVDCNLKVNAGHGLHYHNVKAIAALNDICELNIGHAIISRSIFTGLDEAVREMKKLMQDARVR